MSAFIWVVIVFYTLEVISHGILVKTKAYLKPRDPWVLIADMAILAGMVVWGAVLLSK